MDTKHDLTFYIKEWDWSKLPKCTRISFLGYANSFRLVPGSRNLPFLHITFNNLHKKFLNFSYFLYTWYGIPVAVNLAFTMKRLTSASLGSAVSNAVPNLVGVTSPSRSGIWVGLPYVFLLKDFLGYLQFTILALSEKAFRELVWVLEENLPLAFSLFPFQPLTFSTSERA